MINDHFGTSRSILHHIGKGYFYRNVSRHARVRKDLHPDKWHKPVFKKRGNLGIIMRLQKYGKLANGKKNIDDHTGSKAWKIKVECRRYAAMRIGWQMNETKRKTLKMGMLQVSVCYGGTKISWDSRIDSRKFPW